MPKVVIDQATLAEAAKLFEGFRERDMGSIETRGLLIPDAVVEVGKFHAFEYFTTHGKRRELYRHEFERSARPDFLVSPDGRQIFVLGGSFRFTKRGIVDKPR